ncbi:Detected protein of unknown function [Hibiscus syriacus]|uniref:Auxin-responsive protein n=1 Tax=Hibiscus syriacus TaxID=106335 RepID=A0A6A3ABV5_HIBSY|nr:Detected protein of unknown function [Hibiscus syriacus]
MDSNASGFLLNNSILQTVYCQNSEENGMIDLGLSLRTFQPQPYQPSTFQVSSSHRKSSNAEYSELAPKDPGDEAEGVQSKERCAYVKVNMDGVMVGRKVCMLDQGGYLGLARQLEDDDTEDNWKNVSDVPWKEFAEQVKRLRIGRKNEAVYRPCSSSFN